MIFVFCLREKQPNKHNHIRDKKTVLGERKGGFDSKPINEKICRTIQNFFVTLLYFNMKFQTHS